MSTQDDDRTDAELLAAWATGSRTAGGVLIERYFAVVHRFFRTKTSSEVDDLVQQTFLGCVEARERYRADASFKTFLLAIARNQLFNHYRRKHEHADLTLSSIRDLGTSPSGVVAKRQDERLVAEALQRVSLDAQVILELAYWEDLNGVELAQVLEVPLNTAYSQLRRAKQSLRGRLEELAPDHASLARAWRAVAAIPDALPANDSPGSLKPQI